MVGAGGGGRGGGSGGEVTSGPPGPVLVPEGAASSRLRLGRACSLSCRCTTRKLSILRLFSFVSHQSVQRQQAARTLWSSSSLSQPHFPSPAFLGTAVFEAVRSRVDSATNLFSLSRPTVPISLSGGVNEIVKLSG